MDINKDFHDDLRALFGDPAIIVYTRAMGIADGALIDVTDIARRAGFRLPVAVTAALFNALPEGYRADKRGAVTDLLTTANAAVFALPDKNTDRAHFGIADATGKHIAAYVLFHSGDEGEPVMTLMLEGED